MLGLNSSRGRRLTAENNTGKNMEPASRTSTLSQGEVGSLLSAAFIQTESDSSHLESLKPAQRGAEEDFRKERERKNKKEERGETVRKEEDGMFSPQAARGRRDCPQVLMCPSRLTPSLLCHF